MPLRVLFYTFLFAATVTRIVGATDPDDGTLLDHDLSRAELAGGRDLSQYEDGGDFFENRMELADVIALRTFIWQHWKQKKRGYVRFKFCGTDHCVTSHMFIEPLNKSAWYIQQRSINLWQGAGAEFVTRRLFDDKLIKIEPQGRDGTDYCGDTALLLIHENGEVTQL